MRHGKTVVRDRNVANFALLFRLERRVVQAVFSSRLRAEGGIVELIDVDVVGFQRAETGLQILPEALRRLRAGLRRQHDLVAHRRERRADLLLAVGIRARRVEKVDATVIRLVQQVDRILLSDALDRQAAKSVFLDDKIRLAKRDLVHGNSPSYPGYPKHSKIALFLQYPVSRLTTRRTPAIM